MSQAKLSRRQSIAVRVLTYVILAAIMAMGIANAQTATVRSAVLVLSLVFGVLLALMPSPEAPSWTAHLYLAIQTGLVAGLMYLHRDWTLFTVMYFLLSAQAMLLLPPRLGSAWITGLVVVTAFFSLFKWGWPGGLLPVLLYAGAYTFFGIFINAMAGAETARRESQTLLAELQKAHQQLQEYALRAEELAVVEERNRLAREMHDTLGHHLTVASVQLEAAQRLCPTDSERAASMVGTVREQVREALSELRSTVAALRTPIEADLQLRSSLRRMIAHFEEATGLTVHQVLPEEMPDLPNDHRLALYRAAQEALTNVQRHAEASQVWLVLAVGDAADGWVTLLVSDDGRGYSGQAGFGLRGLRERAAQLGGELYLEPRRGGGTQLSLRLPLPREGSDG